MTAVICIGHCTLDMIYRVPAIPSSPTKVVAHAYAECGGGMAANASVAIARLGGRASYWGVVGDDGVGGRIVAGLAAEGVDVAAVRRIAGARSAVSAIVVDDAGERLICTYTDPELDPDPGWLRLDRVAQADAVLADVRWPAGAAAVLDAARAAGRIAVLDADVGPADVLADLSSRATHVIYSEPGLAAASGGLPPGAALRHVSRQGSALRGVTLGADGLLWLDGGEERRTPAPQVQVVDTLAAGDVWHGAFTLALAERRAFDDAVRFAHIAAAIKCTRGPGRLGAPSREEVDAALARDRTLGARPAAPRST
jgi:sugar/nucleoside kinase (ribokinase family)